MKFFVKTFGCQMNVSDSTQVESILLSNSNFSLTQEISNADIIIVNTCSVRKHAEDRAESFIGELKKLKVKNEKLKVIVIGCYAQKSKIELKKKFPYIDTFIGPLEYDYLPQILTRLLNIQIKNQKSKISHRLTFTPLDNFVSNGARINTDITKQNNTIQSTLDIEHRTLDYHANKISAFVPIMTGCNNYCSYCIVPYVRGKERSRPINEILNEINYLLNSGVKEITLLGQNVNSYKNENEEWKMKNGEKQNFDFTKLLEKIATINLHSSLSTLHNKNNKFWIRFMTNHPKDMNKEIVSVIKKYSNICKHIHLPLQSGSDKILNLMNRKYTSEQFYDLIQTIRIIIPNISITTDLIVGFPKETEEDFMQTYNLVEKIQFDSAFVFKYSPRDGTKAAEFSDDVSKETKEKRHLQLLSLCESIAKNVNYKYINNIYQGLVFDKKEPNKYYARLESNRVVELKTEKKLELGNFVNIKIVDIKKHNLVGKIVN